MFKHKKKIIIIVAIIFFAFIFSFVLIKKNSQNNIQQSGTVGEETKINLNPPTQEDLKRAEENKQAIENRDQLIENQKNQNSSPGAIKTVKPVITYAGQYGQQVEVGGYVGDLFEDGGTCTAKFSKDGATPFSKSVQATKNANSVDCPVMIAKNDEFQTKGTWSVVVSYVSPNSTGYSDARTIEVK